MSVVVSWRVVDPLTKIRQAKVAQGREPEEPALYEYKVFIF
jgi:hypothetical protein